MKTYVLELHTLGEEGGLDSLATAQAESPGEALRKVTSVPLPEPYKCAFNPGVYLSTTPLSNVWIFCVDELNQALSGNEL